MGTTGSRFNNIRAAVTPAGTGLASLASGIASGTTGTGIINAATDFGALAYQQAGYLSQPTTTQGSDPNARLFAMIQQQQIMAAIMQGLQGASQAFQALLQNKKPGHDGPGSCGKGNTMLAQNGSGCPNGQCGRGPQTPPPTKDVAPPPTVQQPTATTG